jgi:hypothetical protein
MALPMHQTNSDPRDLVHGRRTTGAAAGVTGSGETRTRDFAQPTLDALLPTGADESAEGSESNANPS